MFVEHKEAGEAHEVKPLDEASRLLLKAADILEKRGHCKGRAHNGESVCLSAALTVADNYAITRVRFEAYTRLMKAIHGGPIEWNDHPERTKEEVVAKLRAVALGN